MFETYFLICLGLIWIIFATITDIKKREIPNWLNFSLIIFAIGFRFFYSLFELPNLNLFCQGIIWGIIFFVLHNLFYYMKLFAGGDAKLMFALGTILPIYPTFNQNLKTISLFLFIFLLAGAIYGIITVIYLGIKHHKRFSKEFKKQFKKNKKLINTTTLISIFLLISSLIIKPFIGIAAIIFIFPYLYIYTKSIDEACMIKKIKGTQLTVGDWLYEDIKLKNKTIKANWDGVSPEELKILKNKKEILVRYGIQYAPVFLISFITWIILIKINFFFMAIF